MSPLDRDAAAVVPAWPVVHLALDGSGQATVDGTALDVPDGEDAQVTLLAAATHRALDLGRPVRVQAVDPVGTWTLVAFPDGSVDELVDESDDEAAQDEAAQDEAVQDEAVQDEAVQDEAVQDAIDDLDDVPWHLRVHPNGQIVPMDDLGLPADDEPAFRPTAGWVPAPAVEETPVEETPVEDTPADDTPADDTPADDHDAALPEPVAVDAAALTAPAGQDWHDLVDPPALAPPALAPPPDAHDLVHELRASADVEPEPRPSRRWIPLTLAATLGVLAVGGAVVAVRDAGPRASTAAATSSRSTATPPSTPPSITGPATGTRASVALPATLGIAPPPGFTAAPVWGVPVAGETALAIGADGLIAVLTTDRRLALIDPGSGAVRWHAATPPQAVGPHLSRVGDRRVLAMLTTSRLLYWALPDGGVPAAGAAPVEVPLPAGSTVTWTGPSPLVTLGDGSVGVVQGAAVQRVNLPSGARALAADGAEVLAVAGRNWVRQPAGSPPAPPKELPVPEGANRTAPLRVENVGGDFLGAMWAGPGGPIVSVHDAHSGAKLAQATFPENVDFSTAPTVRENGTDRTTVGSALFDPAHRNLSVLKSPFTPVALVPGHVYATDGSGAVADLQIAGEELTTLRFTGRNPVVPAGVVPAGGRSLALVVVPSGTGRLLAALPRT